MRVVLVGVSVGVGEKEELCITLFMKVDFLVIYCPWSMNSTYVLTHSTFK